MTTDLVVTDPPYSIQSKSDGKGKLSPWPDQVNASMFYAFWLGQCRRIIKSSGAVWSFLSWRTFPIFAKASADLRWPMESVLVWDKGGLGPGGRRGLRPTYELVALWAGPDFVIRNRSLPDIKRCPWMSLKRHHPAEKPVALLRHIIEISGGESVLDPFCGSGSVGVACAELNRSFIGIEMDSSYCRIARARIAAVRRESS